jgi:hypothetical protein
MYVPRITDALFAGYATEVEAYRYYWWLLIWLYLFVAFFLLMVTCRVLRLRISDAGFSVSFLSTLPDSIAAGFSGYIEALQTSDAEALSMDYGPFFQDCDTLTYLVEAILLVNVDNVVIASSLTAREMLLIEDGSNFQELMQDYMARLEFPPVRYQEADLEINSVFARVSVWPVKRFEYRSQIVAYVVKMRDIQELDAVIKDINTQANEFRLLAAHLVPWPVANALVNEGQAEPPPHDGAKLLAATFMLDSKGPFEEDDLPSLQVIIAECLQEHPQLIYTGRSAQVFRITTGQFGTEISKGHPGTIVLVALDLIREFTEYARARGREWQVYCGIHSGRTHGWRIRDYLKIDEDREPEPIIFEPLLSPLRISTIVAANGKPNAANISRDMYQDIFGEGFVVGFHDELLGAGGQLIQIHVAKRREDDAPQDQAFDAHEDD